MHDVAHSYSPVVDHPTLEIEKFAAWTLGMAVSVAVLFQVHVSLPGGVINLNLADPLAVLALAAVSLRAVFAAQAPLWRVHHFNLILGVISVLLVFGFVRGWLEIGITQWALGGRLFGWVVLLGYLSAGYLIVTYAGGHGLRRFTETLLSTAAAIVVLQLCLRLLHHWDVNTGVRLTPNFEGYAGNRNAFAFQLLAVMTLCLGYSSVYSRYAAFSQRQAWKFPLLFGILLAGLVWTGSRTGILVGAIILVLPFLVRLADRDMIYKGIVVAVLLWGGTLIASQKMLIQSLMSGEVSFMSILSGSASLKFSLSGYGLVQSTISSDDSHVERWQTLVHGIEMWLESPLLGAGLGVFYEKSPAWMGHAQVIHNTPLWVLAEFGLLGGAVFGWAFLVLGLDVVKSKKTRPSQLAFVLVFVAFAIFCLAHEILYQRIFWLVLGAVLAVPFAVSSTHERSH